MAKISFSLRKFLANGRLRQNSLAIANAMAWCTQVFSALIHSGFWYCRFVFCPLVPVFLGGVQGTSAKTTLLETLMRTPGLHLRQSLLGWSLVSGRRIRVCSDFFWTAMFPYVLGIKNKGKTAKTWGPRLGLEVQDVLLPNIGDQPGCDYPRHQNDYIWGPKKSCNRKESSEDFPRIFWTIWVFNT